MNMSKWEDTGHIIGELMKQLSDTPRGRLENGRRLWRDTVGAVLSSHSIVGVVRDDGKWVVYTENSAWMQELFMQKRKLIQKLNDMAGKTVVSEIEFKAGQMPVSSAVRFSSIEMEEPLPSLTPDQEEEVATQCEDIPIPELRTAIGQLRRRQLQLDQARLGAGWQPCEYCQVLTDCKDRICDRCRARLQQEQHRQLLQFLVRHPAAEYDEVRRTLPVLEKEYEEARHYLIHRTLDRVWHRQETDEEQWLLARLLTRLDGDKLTVAHKENLINKLNRKKPTDESQNY